jgi:hypothetical protein
VAPPKLLHRQVDVDAVGEDPPGFERRLYVDEVAWNRLVVR